VGWAAVNLPYGRWRLILVNGPRTGRPSSIRLSASFAQGNQADVRRDVHLRQRFARLEGEEVRDVNWRLGQKPS
jgi:hypothetical protein